MRKIFTILILSMLLLSVSFVSAHEHNFDETKQLIDSGISCDKLTDEQLETIGDYYMEQMHPGEAHEMMDKMMGGEGSESLRLVHINMAKRLYCNEDVGGMMGSNMMGSGGMGMMGSGMMGSNFIGTGYADYFGLGNLTAILFWAAIIFFAVWIIYKLARKVEQSETPIAILKKRYAKGEITQKQFELMKKEIG